MFLKKSLWKDSLQQQNFFQRGSSFRGIWEDPFVDNLTFTDTIARREPIPIEPREGQSSETQNQCP